MGKVEPPDGSRQTNRSRLSAKEKQDESIMGTNNSCIVSKRSVEKIYHKKDDGFLRYFVRKFQRRSPLINRGYWLRMRAIDNTVRRFLEEPCGDKVVVNLGCGYDPLPFNFLAHEFHLCGKTTFIDVDYQQLIQKKCDIIRSTPHLNATIPDLISNFSEQIPLSSTRYKAVACDLEDIQKLEAIIASQVDTSSCAFLFIAEVSLTYVDAAAAERVLAWTSTLRNARFCLLEQFLPDGPLHPFARTMLKHFEKLNSPLRSALRFPSLQDQCRRFLKAGWPDVNAVSLWQLWADNNFLRPAERQALNHVEPFDEWEEFALFASHYFLLTARTLDASSDKNASEVPSPVYATKNAYAPENPLTTKFAPHSGGRGCRRFGAAVCLNESKIIHHGGHGTRGRLHDYDCFHPLELNDEPQKGLQSISMAFTHSDVMCHTISSLEDGRCLLVGGRTSPESGSAKCLIGSETIWTETNRLPYDLYRHCAVAIGQQQGHSGQSAVLLFGGKSGSGEVHDEWLYWTETNGWRILEVVGGRPCARFGASMSAFGTYERKGLLIGGLSRDGKVLSDVWTWELVGNSASKILCIDVTGQLVCNDASRKECVSRFGASMVAASNGVYLVGGVSGPAFLGEDTEIVHIDKELQVTNVSLSISGPRPLLIGCAVQATDDESFVILGGGAVCFSFGPYWNEGCYTVRTSSSKAGALTWCLETQADEELLNTGKKASATKQIDEYSSLTNRKLQVLPRTCTATDGLVISANELKDTGGFSTLVQKGSAALLRGFPIGSCMSLWTSEYLKERVGKGRAVVVHVADSPTMNFLWKDFSYKTMHFGEFLDQAESGRHVYLRSLSANRPADQVTNLYEDYATIAGDFSIPQELEYLKDRVHSMPLRISGPVTMWLHYDVMSNVLFQIRGSKRLIVFPPSDIGHLDFPAGASSSRISIFDDDGQANFPASTHPMTFDLEPGDILYIPALWPHTAQPTSGLSVAVNVFFRSLERGYAAGKDVYGNRDVQGYENGRRDLQKISRAFAQLPSEMGKFYMQRLAGELSEMAEKWGDGHGGRS